MRTALSRVHLLGGAAISLGLGVAFATAKTARATPAKPSASTRANISTTSREYSPMMQRVVWTRTFPLQCSATTGGATKTMREKATSPQRVGGGVQFGEGPSIAWDDMLYFVDALSGHIKRITANGAEEWLATGLPGGRGVPNGSKFYDGVLYICDNGRKQMLAVTRDKQVTVLADAARGDMVNGPNDCAFDASGNFYFTDPNASKEITSGVYFCRRQPDGTFATREFAAGFQFPNGIAVAPDGKSVFVAETNANRITRVILNADGTAGARSTFCDLPPSPVGPDGMRFDDAGRLFVAHFAAGAVQVISPDGKLLDTLDTNGKNPTNVAFTHDFKTLYVTESASGTVVKIDLSQWRLDHAS